ncbi:hypothetical protein SPRG_01286 [Saprolegnia parasitica CBS 223.65]|uniref:Tubulin--tyrosine ligase-like protein 12 SET-like domain-containing protein n=1 Tax=Saprolegnia parasitica (strain CBS 223.65) TaxID=695850 RepID=A0A067D4R3_SAPPC|nr:hypothetical protein SPRG_01286 [Saprolegnia parasitica CBS 223.65]KDO34012.1 hypothetical protein SPRG_01286 [Saprolegnia parasitica CBS 223.65]|eukprot:XP_012194897.1 hypothetical protein SPRG_01286 [Saprolegnia parasitica CBS 223.65]
MSAKAFAMFLTHHEAQLRGAAIPEHLWPSLFEKLSNEIFDAGSYFQLAADEDGDLHAVALRDMAAADADAVFLIDHAWTYTTDNDQARVALMTAPSLLPRMEALMQLPADESATTHDRATAVLRAMWRYANSYRLGHLRPEEAATIWYIMDEFGSAIEHADAPTFRMAPFYYAPAQCAFSILWPIQDVEAGDFASLAYATAATDDVRIALLAGIFFPSGEEYVAQLPAICAARRLRQTSIYDAQATRDDEVVSASASVRTPASSWALPIKVCTDLKLMKEFLDDPNFVFVDNENDANVVWPTRHIKDYVSLETNGNVKVFNQFPNEKVLTCKDLLYETCKRACNNQQPPFMALTYNMESELPELMQEYVRRDAAGEDNVWICKPWNLARSLDTTIATSSANLAKLAQTGPKVACKYITQPLLIKERKFDFRFLVMVVNTQPLELYVSGVYWLRIANKPFTMDNFDDFQKHFTVMNYTDYGVEIMHNQEFEDQFAREYPSQDWTLVKADIFNAIKALFVAATSHPAPQGLGHSNKSRALYGVDVMLEWRDDVIHPVVLECNFHPDCTRASRYFPKFFNDLLNVLVLNKPEATVYGATKL